MTASPRGGYPAIELHDGGIAVLMVNEGHLSDPSRRIVHGGVIAGFMERAAALVLGEGRAVDFSADFLRPAGARPLYARTSVVRRGSRFATVRVEAWQDDESAPVAIGAGTFLRSER